MNRFETNKKTLDNFANVLKKIVQELKEKPDLVENSPTSTPTGRLDEVAAARNLNLRWSPPQDS